MADYGIKVSKEGEDVKTIPNSYANVQKFSLISSVDISGAGFSLLKVKTAIKVTIANGATETIAHGLSYKPLFWVFLNTSGVLTPVYYDTQGTYAYIDATNLVIKNATGGSKDFYYYIFYDPV
jgi:hypothetical protein